MAENSAINWTDHTFNPWWGCTRIAPGCDNCYAATLDRRFGGDRNGNFYWDDPTIKPKRLKPKNWNKVLEWHREAVKNNKPIKVFCGSMMDWCDKKAPDGARDDLFELIRSTPMIHWQLLTKRAKRITRCLPKDWGDGYDNVWLGVTCEDIEHGCKRVDILNKIPAKVRFVSAEPLLCDVSSAINLDNIDWVIIGGETGHGYRRMKREWAYRLISKCKRENVSVWFKQWGGNDKDKGGDLVKGAVINQWPKQWSVNL